MDVGQNNGTNPASSPNRRQPNVTATTCAPGATRAPNGSYNLTGAGDTLTAGEEHIGAHGTGTLPDPTAPDTTGALVLGYNNG